MRYRLTNNPTGFTVVEMMIATLVFSAVLMICTTALIQIGRTFYKGVSITNTQEVARSVIDEVSDSIEFSASEIVQLTNNGDGTEGYCIGNLRYSYRRGLMLGDSSSSHALVVDRLDQVPVQCAGSVQALPLASVSLPSNSRELLSPRMRIAKFTITSLGNRLYSVKIRLITGEYDLLTPTPLSESTAADPNAKCGGIIAGSQFCAAVQLTTTVQKRLQ